MSKLSAYRTQQHLTQDELSEKSGISVRTIQRIEAGYEPKGYTLKALAKALGINESDLLESPDKSLINIQQAKYINLISLPFIIIPPLNIIAPLILMYYKKEYSPIAKQIISLQIIWTLISAVLFFLSPFINRIFSSDFPFILITAGVALLTDIYIILQNAVSLDKHKKLHICLKINIL